MTDTVLAQCLLDPAVRPKAIDALVEAVESEVASRSGVTGAAVKTGYKAVTAIKPALVREAIDRMLPDFANQLDPFWISRGDRSFADQLAVHSDAASDALLAVTDERAQRPNNAVFAKLYKVLRPKAKGLVEQSLPRVGVAIESVAV